MSVFTTACPRNCYSTCSLKVHVEDGRLRRIEAHPDNRATTEGPCLKGLSYVERAHSPDRILHPLLRGPSGFERTSWTAALDLIVEKLVHYRDTVGPQSVLYYAASGTKGLMNGVGADFWRLYGGYTTTYGDLCWPAGLEATRLTLGENKHNAPWDLEHAKLVVMWGKNTAETNVHQTVFTNRVLENGGKLVVVDPRRTETAERAELLIQPRPGSDGALALAVGHLLVAQDRVDRDFVAAHVRGFDAYAERVAEWTPARAAEVCEVPEEHVHRLAELIGTSRPVTINCGFGMQRYTNSGQAMRAILALLVITGNIGKPGASWVFADLQSLIFDAVKDPVAAFPPADPARRDDGARVAISTSRLGADMLALRDPPLRMAWVERGNPVTQNPDTNTVRRAFRALDFRVVIEQFMTDTAREADLVLPAKTMFEQTDVIGAYWHPYVQLKQKVFDPPGEVKPESEVYWHLARRLGFAPEETADVLPGPDDDAVHAYLDARLAPFPGLTRERLAEGPLIAPGHQEVAFSDHVFPTPSGKIELASDEAVERWGVEPVAGYAEPEESLRSAGELARRYPLHFMTPNTKNRIHSQFNNLQTIRALSPKPFLQMHPADAEARGVADGARVRVFNERGELDAVEVRLDHGIKPGCVAMTNGWWISEGGAVNFCSLGRETDMGHGAAFHDNLVEVERVS